VNTSAGSIRHSLIAGLTSLLFSAGAIANILPTPVDYPIERPAQPVGKKRLSDNRLSQRPIGNFSASLFATSSGIGDEERLFEATYAMLSGLGSPEQPADLAYGANGTPGDWEPAGGTLFRRVVLSDNDYPGYPDTALLAALFLVVGMIGYAQHLIRKSQQQPKRRPLFPA